MKITVTVRWQVNGREVEKSAAADVEEHAYMLAEPEGAKERHAMEMAKALFESIFLSQK